MAYIRVFIFFIALFLCWYVAPFLPVSMGWENGLVENLQALVLLGGGVTSLFWYKKTQDSQARMFWLIITPVWLTLFARELSWGAVFMQPMDFSSEFGPTFSSSQQLPYKSMIAPVLGVILLLQCWAFIRTLQHQTLLRIWRAGAFPMVEIALFVLAFAVSTEAEGHGILKIFQSMSHSAQQILEEMSELMGYIALLMAQNRVAHAMKNPNQER
jgi:hypothetical protein